jgi:hypothetical protein
MTPENLAKANAAQKAADERRRREAEEQARKKLEGETPKLHAAPGQRRGQLKNGNPAGDYLAAPRCGARTRVGGCCRQPAMANGRCRMHGGLSTGARTPEGQARARAARFVHGFRTAEIIDFRVAAARSARRLATLTRLAREATAPAGHGVHRSDSSSALGEAMNREDTKLALGPRAARTRGAQREPVECATTRAESTVIARAQPAQESERNAMRAGKSAFTRLLRVFAPSRFNSSAAAAGHGVQRSLSWPSLGGRRAAG